MADSHGHFQGRSEPVLTVTIVFLVLSTIFVSLRMISRGAVVKKISLDDYFIVLAWAIAFGLSFAICYGVFHGLGRHERSIPNEWQENLRKADYVFSVLYQPALMATKTSILAFYLSLPTTNKNFKWACIGTLFVVNAGGLALGLFTVFQCRPVGASWDVPTPSSAVCSDIITIYLSSTPLNVITDLAILFLPMPILTQMRLPRKQKIILIITFSFGAFVAAVDVVRIVYLQSASMTKLEQIYSLTKSDDRYTDEETDFSWYASLSFMWSGVEVHVGIMCACVPGLKPLVSRFLPKMLRDSGDATTKNGSISMPSGNGNMSGEQNIPSVSSAQEDVQPPDFVEPHEAPNDDEGPMGMMDFLTTPETTEMPQAQRTQTALTNTSRNTPPDTPHFFDFVDMNRKKSLVQMTARESVFPIAAVTVLFFIWGFEYGLLDVLNQQFQRVAHMSATQGVGIHSAYFAGYFFGPSLIGRMVLKHWGFKACYTVGLGIYGCGTLIFWPAAVLTSFPAFVITNFIVAFGLSILEVSANPFIFLCGPAQYGEMRLNLSQGVQAVGTILAPLIASKAFVHKNLDTPSLVDTQWAYLGISLFTILLAVVYYYVPLPEATDEEIEDAAERMDGANKAKVGNFDIIWITLAFGVFSQFCYVGAQEVNGTAFDVYLGSIAPRYNAANRMAVAHTAFALARFFAAGLGFWVKPRFLLLFFYIGAIIFEVLAMNFRGGTGTAMITMVFFFEGPLFPLIFGQSLRGMGRHAKTASVFITSAVSGGALFPPISNHVAHGDRGPMYALVVGVATLASGTLFPLGLNISPLARRVVDPIKDPTESTDNRPDSTSSRASKALSFLHVGKKAGGESPNAEWKERTSNVT